MQNLLLQATAYGCISSSSEVGDSFCVLLTLSRRHFNSLAPHAMSLGAVCPTTLRMCLKAPTSCFSDKLYTVGDVTDNEIIAACKKLLYLKELGIARNNVVTDALAQQLIPLLGHCERIVVVQCKRITPKFHVTIIGADCKPPLSDNLIESSLACINHDIQTLRDAGARTNNNHNFIAYSRAASDLASAAIQSGAVSTIIDKVLLRQRQAQGTRVVPQKASLWHGAANTLNTIISIHNLCLGDMPTLVFPQDYSGGAEARRLWEFLSTLGLVTRDEQLVATSLGILDGLLPEGNPAALNRRRGLVRHLTSANGNHVLRHAMQILIDTPQHKVETATMALRLLKSVMRTFGMDMCQGPVAKFSGCSNADKSFIIDFVMRGAGTGVNLVQVVDSAMRQATVPQPPLIPVGFRTEWFLLLEYMWRSFKNPVPNCTFERDWLVRLLCEHKLARNFPAYARTKEERHEALLHAQKMMTAMSQCLSDALGRPGVPAKQVVEFAEEHESFLSYAFDELGQYIETYSGLAQQAFGQQQQDVEAQKQARQMISQYFDEQSVSMIIFAVSVLFGVQKELLDDVRKGDNKNKQKATTKLTFLGCDLPPSMCFDEIIQKSVPISSKTLNASRSRVSGADVAAEKAQNGNNSNSNAGSKMPLLRSHIQKHRGALVALTKLGDNFSPAVKSAVQHMLNVL